jgi:GNAT superfamily N-acetyltransferase
MMDALQPTDAPAAATLSHRFGWPHRVADWEMFLTIGQGVAWREAGELVGTAMWFELDDAHATIGLVQVAPEMQGRGLGRKMMQAVIDAARPRALLLHSTAEGAGLYARLGFAPIGMVAQWQGDRRLTTAPSPGIRTATQADTDAILRLDAAATATRRGAFLGKWLQDAVVKIIDGDTGIVGYAMRRPFGRGLLIGPIVAPNENDAIALASALCRPGFLRLDIPASATRLLAWAKTAGLSPAGEVQGMTLGNWGLPDPGIQRYGLATQAIG